MICLPRRRALVAGGAALMGGGWAHGNNSAVIQTIITGATINGVTQAPAQLPDLITATPSGGTLLLPSGHFGGAGLCRSSPSACDVPMTIGGQGMGVTILDATGLTVLNGGDKAIFVPNTAPSGSTPQVTIQNLSLVGASDGGGGAGIRDGGDNCGFIANNVEIYNSYDGILTFMSIVQLTGCNIHDNGGSDGFSHELYCGNGDSAAGTSVTATNCTFTSNTTSTHAFKSRFASTTISGCTLYQNPDNGDVGGSVIDIPQGGAASISGTHIVGRSSAVYYFIGYGFENSNSIAYGNTLTLTNVHLTGGNLPGWGGGYIAAGSFVSGQAHLVINPGCVYDGTQAPNLTGWASVTGSFSPSGM